MESIDKLKAASHMLDNWWTEDNGQTVKVYCGGEPSDMQAVNIGNHWRKMLDSIEAEIAERLAELGIEGQ